MRSTRKRRRALLGVFCCLASLVDAFSSSRPILPPTQLVLEDDSSAIGSTEQPTITLVPSTQVVQWDRNDRIVVDGIDDVSALSEVDEDSSYRQVLQQEIQSAVSSPMHRRETLEFLERFTSQIQSSMISLPLLRAAVHHYAAQEPPVNLVLPSLPVTTHQHWDLETACILRGANRLQSAEQIALALLEGSQDVERLRNLMLAQDWRSLVIRVAVVAHQLSMAQTGSRQAAARQALRVHAPLATRLGLPQLQAQIEEHAFRVIYPRQYCVVSKLYQQNLPLLQKMARFLLQDVTTLLANNAILQDHDWHVAARIKQPYSYWKKLLRRKDRLVYDGVALRIVLQAHAEEDEPPHITRERDVVLCYYVQELLRDRYPEVHASRLKDYIAEPKDNGYQSLHLTSALPIGGAEFPFEVQVRSSEMHRLAEYGVASHWGYKLGATFGRSASSPSSRLLLPSAKDILDATSALDTKSLPTSYMDALSDAQSDLQQSVYVFVAAEQSTGRLLSLPIDSTIADTVAIMGDLIDFSEEACLRTIRRNGKEASMDEVVESGDVIMADVESRDIIIAELVD